MLKAMMELKSVPQGTHILGSCRKHLQPGIDDVQSVISSVWNGPIVCEGVLFFGRAANKKQQANERESKRPRNHISKCKQHIAQAQSSSR